MWYFELIEAEPDSDAPEEEWFSFTKAAQLCLFYIEQLGIEFLSKKSKGGAVVLALFFYVTYVFAVVMWQATGSAVTTPEGDSCRNIKDCFVTLLRLAWFDGNGFDYLQGVINSGLSKNCMHIGNVVWARLYWRLSNLSFGFFFCFVLFCTDGYVVLLVVYVVSTAIILLNGLIGIFGQAFTTSDEAKEDSLDMLRRMAEKIQHMEKRIETLYDE